MIILLTQNDSFIFICVHTCEYTAPLCVKNASKFCFLRMKRKKAKSLLCKRCPILETLVLFYMLQKKFMKVLL